MRTLGRLRSWLRDRLGITKAERDLESTLQLVATAHRELAGTARHVRQARLRLGRKDWPARYAERMNDRADP